MNLKRTFSFLTSKSKKSQQEKYSYVEALLNMAMADGTFHEFEESYLKTVADHFQLSPEDIQMIKTSQDSTTFSLPKQEEDRIRFLHNLVYMMIIDGQVLDNERRLCNYYAGRLGFSESIVDELVFTISHGISDGKGPEETLAMVLWNR